MMRIKINNIVAEAESGQTILEVAGKYGIAIPTLCHKDGTEHYSSCMVCMVKDNKTNGYIPSCTAMVQDGMDIDASGDEVLIIRKKALELLLSEHRAECEAQCRVVCPAGYNIPLMNRLLESGKAKEAVSLTLSETGPDKLRCYDCPGYCENACRRKKIDLPVSIRNIKIFLYESNTRGDNSEKAKYQHNITNNNTSVVDNYILKKRFSSRIGRLEDDEINEWLKECNGEIKRYRDIADFECAGLEAASCMHCDCRAADNCRLRDLAEEYGVKDPKGKLINAPIQKKINSRSGLIFENAKCIKCGLCVRICEDDAASPALCFIYRGFISIISEPLTREFDDILPDIAQKCIDICPTGALGRIK
jgi:predicted molibdopterin-dependent oxidoreductase YjgC